MPVIFCVGLRTSADYEFERAIAQMNRNLAPNVETIFLVSDPSLSHISSTIVRDILLYNGDISMFVLGRGENLDTKNQDRL